MAGDCPRDQQHCQRALQGGGTTHPERGTPLLSPLAHVGTTSLLAQECVSGTRSHSGTVRSGTVARISSTARRSCFLLILLRIVSK